MFCSEGRVFVHNDCPGGIAPSKSCPRGFPGGMVLVEIDPCIILSTVINTQYCWKYHDARGGYHEYHGRCSVPWGNTIL